jgi:hypothetical protein
VGLGTRRGLRRQDAAGGEHLTTNRSSGKRGRVVEDDVGQPRPFRDELTVPPDAQPVVVPADERGPQDPGLPTLLEDRTELVSQLDPIDAAAAHRIVEVTDRCGARLRFLREVRRAGRRVWTPEPYAAVLQMPPQLGTTSRIAT